MPKDPYDNEDLRRSDELRRKRREEYAERQRYLSGLFLLPGQSLREPEYIVDGLLPLSPSPSSPGAHSPASKPPNPQSSGSASKKAQPNEPPPSALAHSYRSRVHGRSPPPLFLPNGGGARGGVEVAATSPEGANVSAASAQNLPLLRRGRAGRGFPKEVTAKTQSAHTTSPKIGSSQSPSTRRTSKSPSTPPTASKRSNIE